MIVTTALRCSLAAWQFGNMGCFLSYVANGDGLEGSFPYRVSGSSAILADVIGVIGKKCLGAVVGNR